MRSVSVMIVVFAAMLLLSVPAFGEESDNTRFSISADEGYVFLAEDENKFLEDGLAFGTSFGYRVFPHVEVRLPILFSLHDDKGLMEGQSADLSLLSITPGLAFHSEGRLALWMFIGGGITLVSSEFEEGGASVRERDTAFATNIGAGVDINVRGPLSIGAGGSVMTASRESVQWDGNESWETFYYYTALGRVIYDF